MTILPLHLHFSLTRSPVKPHSLPHAPRLKLTQHARPQVVAGPPENSVEINGTYPAGVSGQLPSGLRRELMPSHVAVIMDGNRRWARMRGLPIGSGYEAGAQALRRIVELCCEWGIRVLTVFVFSSDNWFRPKVETDLLMDLFERVLKYELQQFERENVRVSLIGDTTKLPKSLQELLANSVGTAQKNSRLHLIMAVNYSGQNDVVQACQKIAVKVNDGLIKPNDINKFLVEKELETNCTDYPHPDLLVRTSGELRISNFLLWQLAYTELYFTNSLWPDFGEDEFVEALFSFQKRQRRYGGRNS
ncbi:hypothetical protein RD792_011792 [Penstemon davidsonii]|uniref:Alkyl transferase n=1 Tax=Penstemon davidsonii TaxID=160366 RepID=A0ABR0CV22_9LAMI|nr:hypothetical protein RD792_011792 [Penstemon davidsonii]